MRPKRPTPTDFDPNTVPIRPAATVMIVDDRPDLQVLLIERNANMTFAGGMWVFPGGAVDPGEADEFEPHCDGLDDAAASAPNKSPTNGQTRARVTDRHDNQEPSNKTVGMPTSTPSTASAFTRPLPS